MAKRLQNLKIEQVALVDKGANQLADVVLFKRMSDAPATPATVTTGTGTVPLQKGADAMPEDVQDTAAIQKDLDAARAEVERVKQELAALTPRQTDQIDVVKAEYAKTLAETEKAREELRKQLEVAQAEAEDARQEVLKIRAARRREKFIKFAQALSNLPGASADDFAETLDTVEAAIPEKAFHKLHALLTSWNTLLEKSRVFEEIGRSGDGPAILSGPAGRLASLAKDLQTSNPKLTYEQAYAEAMRRHPDIYKQYVAEQRGA